MTDDDFDRELEMIRRKRLEELKMSDAETEQSGGTIDWPDHPITVTDRDFKDVINKYPYVIVDCWAPWCGPCRMIAPVIEELARDYKGKVVFGKLNTDENASTAMSFGIMSIPTLLFFKNGKLVDQVLGAMPRQMLEPKVQSHL